MTDWPDGWVSAAEDERSEQYMWMEDIPNNLENHC